MGYTHYFTSDCLRQGHIMRSIKERCREVVSGFPYKRVGPVRISRPELHDRKGFILRWEVDDGSTAPETL